MWGGNKNHGYVQNKYGGETTKTTALVHEKYRCGYGATKPTVTGNKKNAGEGNKTRSACSQKIRGGCGEQTHSDG
jgi:hypothetical protein